MPATRADSDLPPSMAAPPQLPPGYHPSFGAGTSTMHVGGLNTAATDHPTSPSAALSWDAQLQRLKEHVTVSADDATADINASQMPAQQSLQQRPPQQHLQHPAWTLQRVSENEEWALQGSGEMQAAGRIREAPPLLLPDSPSIPPASGAAPWGGAGSPTRSLHSETPPGRTMLGERWVRAGGELAIWAPSDRRECARGQAVSLTGGREQTKVVK